MSKVRCFAMCAVVAAMVLAMAQSTRAAAAEDNRPPEGFTALFNGKDLTGWKADPQGHWKADGGVMVYDGKARDLATEKSFGEFVLLIDWKIEKGGNSGVFLRGEPQVEIWDVQATGSGGIYPDHHKPLKAADKPFGQWNRMEIKLEKEKVTVHLNGELVLDNFECKFKKATGPIVLQHHGSPLWFKNIYIKELK